VKTLLALLCACAAAAAADWKQERGARWTPLPPFAGKAAGFKLIPAAETGVNFTNLLGEESIAHNRILANGSGVALGDFDGDGLPDIFACGLESASKLYRNLGDWKFQDQTVAAGLPADFQNVRGAVFADINGDGQVDLLVSTVADGVRCFQNFNGKFTETTPQSGLQHRSGSTTLALADIDGNGTLDLYVTNYRTNDIRDVGRVSFKNAGGKPLIPAEQKSRFIFRRGEISEYGEPDQLYLNDGKGHFTAVSWTDGAFLDADGKPLKEPPLDWGLTATFRDVNGDGAPDLYVCNDYWTPDRFWINDGKGHFRAISRMALRKIPSSSMGVDFADINRDGLLDFFAVEMLASDSRVRKRQRFADKPEWPVIGSNDDRPQVFQNTLFLGRADGTYAEAACFAGLEASDWSWSPLFIDIDLDGFEDLLISAGHFHDVQDLDSQREIQRLQHSWSGYTNEVARQHAYTKELFDHYRLYPPLQLPVRAFRNGGDLHFKDMTADWGFNVASVHHGMALADLDGDGDLDVVVNSLNSGLEIYRNHADAPRIAVRLKGNSIGAKVLLRDESGIQQKEITAGGSYLSGSEAIAALAIRGNASLQVKWRNGRESVISEIKPNRLYEISEPNGAPVAVAAKAPIKPLFEDVSERLNHIHHETAFDDYQRQPTLPFKISQPGPALAWADLNADGYEDLIVGAGAGGAPAVFYADEKGKFTRGAFAGELPASGDYVGLLVWIRETNLTSIFAAVSGYESPQAKPLLQIDAKGRGVELPAKVTSASVLALGCFAPPGGMALFVGGGVEPGRYPLATRCALLRFENGAWKYDVRNSDLLSGVGLVNGALWSDLDGDGMSELILACEWGPIRVFANRGGVLSEITSELGLANVTGLWKGIATADVNGDGRLDIIAANWGLNSPWQATPEHPFTAYYGEMVQPGRMEFIETEWDNATSALTARRPLERIADSLPFVLEQFTSFKDFAAAPIDRLLGERKALAKQVSVNTLASTLFLNTGRKFRAVPLPDEAQLAPAFCVSAADFDGDGNIDLFLSQNFMAMHPDYARQDAGRGLLLKGAGDGTFKALSGDESGLKIYGEQRAAAVCDFDHDGRMDLAVGQNGAETKLYRNVGAKPGLRVKLIGPPGNRSAIGAQMWLEKEGKKTAVQEIQFGSGYLAQDSAVKIFGASNGAKVIVRWPGGELSSAEKKADATEVELAAPGVMP
jgi:hypothetical protein